MEIEPTAVPNLESVIAILTAAFVNDPVCHHFYPDLQKYFVHFPEFGRPFAEAGLAMG